MIEKESDMQNFIVSHSAVNKMRTLVPKLAHMSDEGVREFIQTVIADVDLENKSEEYYEDDPAYGPQKNIIVELSLQGNYGRFTTFAIVREAEDGLIIVTFISRQARDEAISQRWYTLPMEKDPRSEEPINKPFENLAEEDIEVKKPDYIVSYVGDDGEDTLFVGPSRPNRDLLTCIESLLKRGIELRTVSVWEKKDVEVSLRVDLRFHD